MKQRSQKQSSVHVALRIPTKSMAGSQTIDVLEEHNRVIEAHGRVAFAKFGDHNRKPNLAGLREALDAGKHCFLFTFNRRGNHILAGRAPITNYAVGARPFGIETPEYYKKLYLTASCWFVLSRRFEPCSLDGLYLVTNHRPLSEVATQCRTVMMLVEGGHFPRKKNN